MAKLKVDTGVVITTVTNIRILNTEMRDAFESVQSAISRLDSSWDGSAATAAVSKFNEVKAAYVESRYNVVENFAKFLLQQVGEGYEQTEDANKSLADAFK